MLTCVTDYPSLEPLLDSLLKGGIATNALPNPAALRQEIGNGTLWMQEAEEGLLLIHRRAEFDRLTYLLRRGAGVPTFRPERTTLLEIPYRIADEGSARLSGDWGQRGFALALRRKRLTRPAGAPMAEPIEPAGNLQQALLILNTMFSPLTACLPGREELEKAIAEGRILMQGGGLLHFQIDGKISELRHLAVLPEHQHRGTARALIRGFLTLRGDGRCRVWTGETNAPALHLYHSFGFAEDGWQSDVRIFGKDLT